MEPIKMIDNTQKKLIHLAIAQLKMSDETYRQILEKYFWVKSSTELTYAEASRLIDWMKDRGFKIKTQRAESREQRATKKKLPPTITQLPSPEILDMIERLKADITWHAKPDGYQRWLKKYMGIDRPATMKQAQKIVEALKSMRARQQRAQDDTGGMHDRPSNMMGRYRW